MKKGAQITTLFLDVGGVLLTNGWDRHSRELAAKTFELDLADMESRHGQTFNTFELGKISLEEYLKRVVFYEKRPFTLNQFTEFMFAQSKPYPQIIELICALKAQYGLKIGVVSNEGKELNDYRIKKYQLGQFVDFFLTSCIVHLTKPDEDIFRLAINVSHVPVNQIVYIEDREMFVQVAENLGIHGLHHTDYNSTCAKLASFGLGSHGT